MTQELAVYEGEAVEDSALQIIDAPDIGTVPTIYHTASTLALSDKESAALTAPFSEDDVEIRPEKEGLIYIPHYPLRVRLNNVIGPGQWSMVPMGDPILRDSKVYQSWALYIRGRFVSQTMASASYFENNNRADFSDSLETVKSEALRRLCKDIGIGLEAWDRRFAKAWRDEHAVKVFVDNKKTGKTEVAWRRRDDEPFWNETGVVPNKGTTAAPKTRTQETASQSSDEGNGGGGSASVGPDTEINAGQPEPVAPKSGNSKGKSKAKRHDGDFAVVAVEFTPESPYTGKVTLENLDGKQVEFTVWSETAFEVCRKSFADGTKMIRGTYTYKKIPDDAEKYAGKEFFNLEDAEEIGS